MMYDGARLHPPHAVRVRPAQPRADADGLCCAACGREFTACPGLDWHALGRAALLFGGAAALVTVTTTLVNLMILGGG